MEYIRIDSENIFQVKIVNEGSPLSKFLEYNNSYFYFKFKHKLFFSHLKYNFQNTLYPYNIYFRYTIVLHNSRDVDTF